jgi:hypothetical protein
MHLSMADNISKWRFQIFNTKILYLSSKRKTIFFSEASENNMIQNDITYFSHKVDHIGWRMPKYYQF